MRYLTPGLMAAYDSMVVGDSCGVGAGAVGVGVGEEVGEGEGVGAGARK